MTELEEIFRDFASAFLGRLKGAKQIAYPKRLARDKLDGTPASLQYVDEYLTYLHQKKKQIPFSAWSSTVMYGGAYVGEVIRTATNNHYAWVDYDDYIPQHPELQAMIPKRNSATCAFLVDRHGSISMPLNKIARYIDEGETHSVRFFAHCDIVNAKKNGARVRAELLKPMSPPVNSAPPKTVVAKTPKPKAIKYDLLLRARSDNIDPRTSKYASIVKVLGQWKGGWKVDVKKLGKATYLMPFVAASFTRGFSSRTRAGVEYFYHPTVAPQEDHVCGAADRFDITFDPQKMELSTLCDNALPKLIGVFHPYFVIVTESDTTYMAPEVNRYHEVGRFGVVNYFDKQLCREAFGMTPAAVAKVVKPHVESATTLHDGVYIVASRDILSARKIQDLGKMLRQLLPNSPFKK